MLSSKQMGFIMDRNIFRQYDIRGIVGTELTIDDARTIGKAFGTFIHNSEESTTVCVGRDNRRSSPELSEGIIEGLTNTGCHVFDISLVPTPVLYYSIHHLGTRGGIMVTGSHNPPQFNGFKICEGTNSLYGEQIQSLRRIAEGGDFAEGYGRIEKIDVIESYTGTLMKKFKINKNIKMVLDAGNGTVGIVAPRLFESFGCKVIPLYCEQDGEFPNHLPDPTIDANLSDLIKAVIENDADVGIAFDGDGDRIGIVDEKGNIIRADYLLALFAGEVLKVRKGPIIFEVKCSSAVEDVIVKAGGTPVLCRTGHSFIKQKMRETNALLAGEMSGHMFFADRYFGYDDAIYATGRLLEILSLNECPLSGLVSKIPIYYNTPEIRISCPDDKKFEVVDNFGKMFSGEEVCTIDGVKVNFDKGWGLLRASNTEPALILRFEAIDKENLRLIKSIFEEKVSNILHVKTEF